MASTSTINEWMEELASSILPPTAAKATPRRRRTINAFQRRLRHHNYARTNQFDVGYQLSGIEEKFQVLSRDDLSDALYTRRNELQEHYERWIPDVLDLLLRLSDDPVQKTRITDVSDASTLIEAPLQLKWADVEANDPIDRSDPIWRVPNFSDLDSDDEEFEASTTTTSPASVKQKPPIEIGLNGQPKNLLFDEIDLNVTDLKSHSVQEQTHQSTPGSEIQLIKQILLVAQGYSPSFFDTRHHSIKIRPDVNLQNISIDAMQCFLERIQPILQNLELVKGWLANKTLSHHVQAIKQLAERYVHEYISSVCTMEEDMMHPKSVQVASCSRTVLRVEACSIPLATIADLVQRIKDTDPITTLEELYELSCERYLTGDAAASKIILPMLTDAFTVYMKPIQGWLDHGSLLPHLNPFFVYAQQTTTADHLWHDWFKLATSGETRPPSFLNPFMNDIFSCGKTVAFINRINSNETVQPRYQTSGLTTEMRALASDPAIPFPAAFSDMLRTQFASALASSTAILRQLLETECGMSQTLDAFEYIYLRRNGVVLDTIETRIFDRIDKCMDNWNDRFLVADMWEDAFATVDCVNLESITVQSAHTSARSMESRRRSVRILGALAIGFTLPWPVANIISKSALTYYRRISLHLLQIRRAKYVLDRTAYIHVQGTPIGDSPSDQLLAQATSFMLTHFTNTLYDHFTTSIVLPMTSQMRKDLQTARTVDAMIDVHETYMAQLEFACLTSKQLTMMRDTLIGLLDMCIRFADLVSTPSGFERGHRRDSDDMETGSFISAQSQRKRGQRRREPKLEDVAESSDEDEEDDDDDDEFEHEGEGYSSFVVLEDNTTLVLEIWKLRVEFKRQLDFFVAGLRGLGRAGGVVEEFEMLADRLEWERRL